MRKSERAAPAKPHLFTLRLWREALGDDRFEWRGRVEFVETGEVRYFREDAALFSWLAAHFARIKAPNRGDPRPPKLDGSD